MLMYATHSLWYSNSIVKSMLYVALRKISNLDRTSETNVDLGFHVGVRGKIYLLGHYENGPFRIHI